jgi:hypothetical protein
MIFIGRIPQRHCKTYRAFVYQVEMLSYGEGWAVLEGL